MTLRSDRENIVQTLIEGFRVLQAFTASEPVLTLGQVADRAGLDTETTFRLVQTLVILGYLERIAGTKQFRLTLKLLELGFCAIVQNQESFFSDPSDRQQLAIRDEYTFAVRTRRRSEVIPVVARKVQQARARGR